MRRAVFCIALVFFFVVLLSGSPSAFAEGLIVNDGATLTMNGSTLDLNCLDLTIENGGTFNLNSGTVSECGNLIVEGGGSLIQGTGTISYCPPSVTTQEVTDIGTTMATGNGTISDLGVSTPTSHGVCWNTAGTPTLADSSTDEGAAAATGVFTSAMSGLSPNIIYYVRAYATNAEGTAYGNEVSFSTTATAAAPTVTTQAASSVGTTTATLNGTVNANGASTIVIFQYGLTTAYGTTVTADQSPLTGTTTTLVSKAITGLTNGVTYHYRVVAQNAYGTTNGADMTFTLGTTPPTATTQVATAIGTTTATLNGTVNANGASTIVTFQYGLTTAYGTTVTADQSPVTGTTTTLVSKGITGIAPGTTYHFRVVAQNAYGTTNGADMTFTLGTTPPTAITQVATAIGTTTTTLNGTVNANGASTSVTFQYGERTAYGTTVTADQSPVTGTTTTLVSKGITGIAPGTTYHFRVVAQNAYGTTNGADMTFTTNQVGTPTVTTANVTDITMTTVTGGGIVTDEGDDPVTARGTCWSTSSNPTIADSSTSDSTGSGSFTSSITGLNPLTTYYIRAYATNIVGTSYGDEIQFTTDDDGTGVEPETQDAGPNGGDGNGDGIRDSLQTTVASLSTAAGTGYLTVAISGCDQIEQVRAYPYESLGVSDPGYTYPFGLVGFHIPCSPVTVRIYYHGAETLDGYLYRKFGPTPDNWSTSIWYTMPGVTFGTKAIGGQTVSYVEFTLTESQLGDDTYSSPIIDQGGPGLFDPASIPTLSEWGIIILFLLTITAALMIIRRRKRASI